MPQTLMEFFTLEATEYLDKLEDALRAPAPDFDRVRRLARALRGAARMADQEAVAEAAGAVQAVAQALVEGTRTWDAELSAAMLRGLDDLRAAVRGLAAGERLPDEAAARAREVAARLGSAAPGRAAVPPQDEPAFLRFLATELRGLAVELTNAIGVLERDPQEREPLKAILRKIRPLRGIQTVNEMAPVGTALAALEDVILQIAELRTAAGPGHLALFRRAREALEETARALARGERPTRGETRRAEIEGLRAEILEAGRPRPEVRSITEFFYADEGPHIVSAPVAEKGAGSLENFFRLEATGSLDLAERLWAELAGAETDEHAHILADRIAQLYADLGDRGVAFGRPRLGAAAREIARAVRERARAPAWQLQALASELGPTVAVTRRVVAASSDEEARADLDEVEHAIRAAAAAGDVVPIESLVYTPEEALARAAELGAELRRLLDAGAAGDELRERLDELHDLLRISTGQATPGG